ncbi:MAG: FAD-dependent monooxygenase [Gammaproteobacteria bacterium]|nr:FAD-dependent monooxygenase [Gammaproteobacteria bacterium]
MADPGHLHDCDVAVVGGGLIGIAAALGVAQQGRRVALVEPNPPRVIRGELGLDLRTLALSPASRALLQRLGGWIDVPAAPYRRMEIWEERGTRTMTFDAAEVGRAELGWIVENGPLCAELWAAAAGHDRVTVHDSRLLDLQPGPAGVALDLGDRQLQARLLVAADGAASAVRQRLGVAVQTYQTGQCALATVVRTAYPHQGTAYQRFLLDGPLALLPGADPHLCSVVWSQSEGQAERRQALPAAAFCEELEQAVQSCLGRVEAVDQRLAFPLKQQLAATFNPQPRVLLLGDAARVIHPLAGLGANLGLEDVGAMLAELEHLGAAADPGGAGQWRALDRRRQARSRLMLWVMAGLGQVYARGDPLSQWVRNMGVRWLDGALPIKRQIMREAMGLGRAGRTLTGARD